jgi:uncharacterized protein YutE (UPF0331/DUF86 family)
MIEERLIKRKLTKLKEYLKELQPFVEILLRDYISEYKNKRTVERDIQLIVECACDINNHILMETQERPPKDYYSSFTDLSKIKVLPQKFASTIIETAGLRNRLVHEYEEIKDNIVYENIGNVLRLYKKYADYIIKYLEKI